MNFKFLNAAIVSLVLSVSGFANAGLITSIDSGATTHDFIFSGFTAGPISESGITYSSTHSSSVYGYESSYGFSGNGLWNGMDMLGLNTQIGAMTIEFDTAVAEVLAFVNYIDTWSGSARISVFDSSFSLLETSALTFSTGGVANSGFDLGFKRNTNEIKYIQFIDQGIGLNNLRSFASTDVPEPSTLAIFALGIMGLASRRFKKQS
jgi:hypothetical protein